MPHEYLDPYTVVSNSLLQITETPFPPNWAFQLTAFMVNGDRLLTEGTLQHIERLCHGYPAMRFPLKLRLGGTTALALTPLFQVLYRHQEQREACTCSWILRGNVTDNHHGYILALALWAEQAEDVLTFELQTIGA